MSIVRRLLGRGLDDADQGTPPHSPDEAPPEPSALAAERVAEDVPKDAAVQEPPAMLHSLTRDSGEPTEPAIGRDRRVTPRDKGLRVGYASDVGQLRDHNEDTLIIFHGVHLGHEASDPIGFFLVADGMGGHRAGEVASSLAARLVSREVLSNVYLPFLLRETRELNLLPVTEILRTAVKKANDQVHEQVPGGGTTLTCALIVGRRAYLAHVGDSRAYLVTNYDMKQVTQDHSYVGRLMELGELSPEEAAVHPQRHVLYRAIGQGDELDIDTYHQPLPPGSRLLLCSDGLSGLVSEEVIGEIVASAPTPQDACQRLLEAANAAGGPDNITAILVETPPD